MLDKDRQIENQSTLASKRIVLLGGSSGIGLAVAQQVVAQGAHAVIASSNQERLQQAADSLGGDAEGRRLDLSDESSIELFFQELGPSIILSTRRATPCNWTSLRQWTSRKPGELLNFAFGQP
jgi:shikimate 5-dehydrogenase